MLAQVGVEMTVVVSLIVITAVLLPGFIVNWVIQRRRPHVRPQGDLQLVLASLVNAAVIHVAFLPWTARLVRMIDSRREWIDHTTELTGYAATLLTASVALGLVFRGLHRLLHPDRTPSHRWWGRTPVAQHLAALTGVLVDHDPPRAWDQVARSLAERGGWVVVKPRDHPAVVGRFGERSRITFSPTEDHDILVEELWWSDQYGNPLAAVQPQRAIWLPITEVEYMQVIWPSEGAGDDA